MRPTAEEAAAIAAALALLFASTADDEATAGTPSPWQRAARLEALGIVDDDV